MVGRIGRAVSGKSETPARRVAGVNPISKMNFGRSMFAGTRLMDRFVVSPRPPIVEDCGFARSMKSKHWRNCSRAGDAKRSRGSLVVASRASLVLADLEGEP